MEPSAVALLGYAGWTILLVTCMGLQRGALTLSGQRAPNSFKTDGTDISPFAQRLARAHANCYENLPVFAAIVLTAIATGHNSVTDPLAPWVLLARMAQSVTHILSTSSPAVMIRFTFFLVQMLIMIWWLIALFSA
jgi:uncharacterized MAPEG superfamily protein